MGKGRKISRKQICTDLLSSWKIFIVKNINNACICLNKKDFVLKKILQYFLMPIADIIFNKFYYKDMKDYFHPNVHRHIELTWDPNDDLIYLAPFNCCGWKTRRGRKKSILYRNGNLCILGGEFHPGKLNFCKFRPLV